MRTLLLVVVVFFGAGLVACERPDANDAESDPETSELETSEAADDDAEISDDDDAPARSGAAAPSGRVIQQSDNLRLERRERDSDIPDLSLLPREERSAPAPQFQGPGADVDLGSLQLRPEVAESLRRAREERESQSDQ